VKNATLSLNICHFVLNSKFKKKMGQIRVNLINFKVQYCFLISDDWIRSNPGYSDLSPIVHSQLRGTAGGGKGGYIISIKIE